MNGPQDTIPDPITCGEQLMAYLDGELDSVSRQQVEEHLSTSAELRQQLKELQQTWDLLDELPREQVQQGFTRTTVEMVALRVEREVESKARATARWRMAGYCLGIGATALAGFLGYASVHKRLDEPNRRLVEDLPILEQLDAYRTAESIDFLRKLDDEGLFREEESDAN